MPPVMQTRLQCSELATPRGCTTAIPQGSIYWKRKQTLNKKDEFDIGRQDTCNKHFGLTRPRSHKCRTLVRDISVKRREPSHTGRVGRVTEKSCETCSGQYVQERSHIEQAVKRKSEVHETSEDEEHDADDPPAQSTL